MGRGLGPANVRWRGAVSKRQNVRLIADDVAHLKVDDSNRADFVKAGSDPFNPFPRQSQDHGMPTMRFLRKSWRNREVLAQWAQRSLDVQEKKKNSKRDR